MSPKCEAPLCRLSGVSVRNLPSHRLRIQRREHAVLVRRRACRGGHAFELLMSRDNAKPLRSVEALRWLTSNFTTDRSKVNELDLTNPPSHSNQSFFLHLTSKKRLTHSQPPNSCLRKGSRLRRRQLSQTHLSLACPLLPCTAYFSHQE